MTYAGRPYRFVGFDAFGAASGCEGAPWTTGQMDTYFAALPPHSMTRTWAFSKAGFAALDRLVASAAARGQFLILVLENDLPDCTSTGGKTNTWYASTYRGAYLAWVRSVVARYAASPAVGMWEMVNEAGQYQGEGRLSGVTMQAFYETTAATIKSIDTRHLVSTGDSAEFEYADGAAGYRQAASGAHVDVLSLHDYESDWITDAPVLSTHWAPCHSAAAALGKPIYIGEMNDGLSRFADRAARAVSVQRSMAGYLSAGAVGVLVWNRTYTSGLYDPDYSITAGDPLIGVVGAWRP